MKHFVYVIYSRSIDKFYIGETEDIDTRLYQHNSGFFQNTFTSRANDWTLHWHLACNDRSQARKIETHLKQMKNRKYLLNLAQFPEMGMKLLERHS